MKVTKLIIRMDEAELTVPAVHKQGGSGVRLDLLADQGHEVQQGV